METEAQAQARYQREDAETARRRRAEGIARRLCCKCGRPVMLSEHAWHPDNLPLHVGCKEKP